MSKRATTDRMPRRHRRAAVLCLALLTAACGTKTEPSASGGTSPAMPATTATDAAESPRPPGSAGAPGATTVTPAPVKRPATPTGPVPTVTEPVTGGDKGRPNAPAPEKLLADAGYVEEERFFSGEATSYKPSGTLTQDGVWAAEPAGTAVYSSRVLVRRPSSATRFNGTVLVEWLNVSSGSDVAIDFGYTNRELLDQGYVYVGVSAQKVGHQTAKESDPARYDTMVHPGDDFSYDMFTQAGRAVLANRFFAPDFGVQRIIASGESQSAGRLTTYINALAQQADVYDAFLVHSRSDGITPLFTDDAPVTDQVTDQPPATGQLPVSQEPVDGEEPMVGDGPAFTVEAPGARIRTDLRSPTLVVLTETDVVHNAGSRQDDSDTYRRWEIAGSAHVDNYALAMLSGTDPEQPALLGRVCEKPINKAHQWWVMNAGLRHLANWIGGGSPPPAGDRMTIGPDGQYVVDEHGNATGGIRLPDTDVPTGTHLGLGNSPAFCGIYGVTIDFDAAKLQALYPDGATYKKKRDDAVDAMLAKGFILDRDAADAKAS